MIRKFSKIFVFVFISFLMCSIILLFKANDVSSNNFIVKVDSAFLNQKIIEIFLQDQISSDSVLINFNDLEKKLNSNPHVRDIKVYKDLVGNVNIEVEQFEPVARIISGINSKKYIDSDGNLFPISSNFSERVVLVHINNELDINNKKLKFSKDLIKMINFINRDDFFSKIISEIEIKSNKNIVIHPQFSKQKFIFGYPDNLEEKFKKIMLFYNNIAPTKGWNTYKTVNVKFRNQIICDKNA